MIALLPIAVIIGKAVDGSFFGGLLERQGELYLSSGIDLSSKNVGEWQDDRFFYGTEFKPKLNSIRVPSHTATPPLPTECFIIVQSNFVKRLDNNNNNNNYYNINSNSNSNNNTE